MQPKNTSGLQISLASALLTVTIIASGLALLTQVAALDAGLAVTGLVTATVITGYCVHFVTGCLIPQTTPNKSTASPSNGKRIWIVALVATMLLAIVTSPVWLSRL